MKAKFLKWLYLLGVGIFAIPISALTAFAANPNIIVDMDSSAPGIQNEITLLPNNIFTTDVVIDIPVNSTLSLFSYSMNWDASELELLSGSVVTFPVSANWTDYQFYDANTLSMHFQEGKCLGGVCTYTTGPYNSVIAQMQWKAIGPKTDSFF